MMFVCLLLCVNYATGFHISEDSSPIEKILGGSALKISRAPYQAAFEYDGKFKSSATIISPTWLILVAHIFINCTDIEKHGAIRTGTSLKETGGNIFEIKKVLPHPDFDLDTLENNLALIELTAPIPYNENQLGIRLPKRYVSRLISMKMVILGFGQVEGLNTSSEFKVVKVEIVSHNLCSVAYNFVQPEDKIICTKAVTGDACDEDAGGPLVFYGELFGIISHIDNCALPGFHPVIIVKLLHYYPWIAEHTKLKLDI